MNTLPKLNLSVTFKENNQVTLIEGYFELLDVTKETGHPELKSYHNFASHGLVKNLGKDLAEAVDVYSLMVEGILQRNKEAEAKQLQPEAAGASAL